MRAPQRGAEASLPLFLCHRRIAVADSQKLQESCRGRENMRLLEWNGCHSRGRGAGSGVGIGIGTELNRGARGCPISDLAQLCISHVLHRIHIIDIDLSLRGRDCAFAMMFLHSAPHLGRAV